MGVRAEDSLRRRAPSRRASSAFGLRGLGSFLCQRLLQQSTARIAITKAPSRVAAVGRAMRDALRSLTSQDHLLITLRYRDGLSIAEAARVLEVDAKPLYRRLQRILESLHAALCTDELTGDVAREVAGELWCDELATGEFGWWRPSKPLNGSTSGDRTVARGELPRRRPARRLHRRPRPHAVGRDRAASL